MKNDPPHNMIELPTWWRFRFNKPRAYSLTLLRVKDHGENSPVYFDFNPFSAGLECIIGPKLVITMPAGAVFTKINNFDANMDK